MPLNWRSWSLWPRPPSSLASGLLFLLSQSCVWPGRTRAARGGRSGGGQSFPGWGLPLAEWQPGSVCPDREANCGLLHPQLITVRGNQPVTHRLSPRPPSALQSSPSVGGDRGGPQAGIPVLSPPTQPQVASDGPEEGCQRLRLCSRDRMGNQEPGAGF